MVNISPLNAFFNCFKAKKAAHALPALCRTAVCGLSGRKKLLQSYFQISYRFIVVCRIEEAEGMTYSAAALTDFDQQKIFTFFQFDNTLFAIRLQRNLYYFYNPFLKYCYREQPYAPVAHTQFA